jgi:alcohol dehydrogenase
MKALVFHGPGQKSWEQTPDPVIQDPTDIIVQIDTTTICGSDLHILKGDVPSVKPGTVLGHEGVGTVVEVGSDAAKFRVGDRVVVPAITTCGTCAYCRVGKAAHCMSTGVGGWVLGNATNGTQAEYVRVPFGETSLHRIPAQLTDAEIIYVSDIIPTAYEMGVQNGQVSPGDTVVVIGAGPVGLSAMLTAQFMSPKRVIAVDLDDNRLAQAVAHFGATHAVNSGREGWMDEVRALSPEGGANVVMEAVGIPPTLEAAFDLVRPCGHVANIGVHGHPVTIPIDRLWIANITITMGLVNGVTAPMLIDLIEAGRLDIKPLTTHTFTLDQFEQAYDVFSHAAANHALKVLLTK